MTFSFTEPRIDDSAYKAEAENFSLEEKKTIEGDIFGGQNDLEINKDELNELLGNLRNELENSPSDGKIAFETAKERCPDIAYATEVLEAFLRAEHCDVKAAARRAENYWEAKFEAFGENAFGSVTLDILNENEIEALKRGVVRFLNVRDKSGRGIIVTNRKDWFLGTRENRNSMKRIFFFIFELASKDKHVQEHGVIFLWHFSSSLDMEDWDRKVSSGFVKKCLELAPIRTCAFHTLNPGFLVIMEGSALKSIFGLKLRHRWIVHSQDLSKEDLVRELGMYGIPSTAVPKYLGGKLDWNNPAWIMDMLERE